jgi:hypothetical protein
LKRRNTLTLKFRWLPLQGATRERQAALKAGHRLIGLKASNPKLV